MRMTIFSARLVKEDEYKLLDLRNTGKVELTEFGDKLCISVTEKQEVRNETCMLCMSCKRIMASSISYQICSQKKPG